MANTSLIAPAACHRVDATVDRHGMRYLEKHEECRALSVLQGETDLTVIDKTEGFRWTNDH